MSYRVREDCRLCGSRALSRVLDLPATPLANEFIPIAEHRGEPQEEFPLWLAACGGCGHVQLPVIVDPARLFREYVYVSGTSPVFVEHFRRYASEVIARQELAPGDLVVEIGSNDGTLLRFFRDAGMRVLGVDPAREIALRATESGVPTWPEFFDARIVEDIRIGFGRAKVVVANNVFAHADDLAGFAGGVRALLADDGVFVFEVSYLVDVLKNTLFDTIYHEHLSYHSLGALDLFFRKLGMAIVDARRVDTHGGSIRVTVANGTRALSARAFDLLAEERALGLDPGGDPRPIFEAFGRIIEQRGEELRRVLATVPRPIVGYGAPAKATTLLRTFGIEGELAAIVDDSPFKQGRFLPGGRVPVVPSSAYADVEPGCVVVLAWNFAASILDKLAPYRARGGTCVVPLPHVVVIEP